MKNSNFKRKDTTLTEQELLLQQLAEIRKNIHSICSQTQCEHYKRCKKFSHVCTSDTKSIYRPLIRNNGGNFDEYIRLRKLLMEKNYPLVIDIAKKMGGYSTNDLCQEGILGLCEAIDRFDLSYGNQFSTFAYIYIRKSILSFIRENQLVKIATKVSYLTKVSEQAYDRLIQENLSCDTDITTKELLKEVKVVRKNKKMSKMTIRTTELSGHLERMKIESDIHHVGYTNHHDSSFVLQEHNDSLFMLLNRQLEKELSNIPIWVAESIKLRFGLCSYESPTPIEEISAVIGLPRKTIEHNIKSFFEKKT